MIVKSWHKTIPSKLLTADGKHKRCLACGDLFPVEFTRRGQMTTRVYCDACRDTKVRDTRLLPSDDAQRCINCGILIGPGYLAPSVDENGLCYVCSRWSRQLVAVSVQSPSVLSSNESGLRRHDDRDGFMTMVSLASTVISRVMAAITPRGEERRLRTLIGAWAGLLQRGCDHKVITFLYPKAPAKDSIIAMANADPLSRIAMGEALTVLNERR